MAESLRDIKRKSQAVEKTKQITRAMNMVAASKLKNAQARMENFKPYADKVMEVLNSLASRVTSTTNPLLAVREAKRIRLIIMTSDRGLCGGFNTNTIKMVEGFLRVRKQEGKEVSLITVGKKARDFFARRNVPLHRNWVQIFPAVAFEHVKEMADTVTTVSLEPSRCTEPLPNCFSIWPRVNPSMRERSFSSMVFEATAPAALWTLIIPAGGWDDPRPSAPLPRQGAVPALLPAASLYSFGA